MVSKKRLEKHKKAWIYSTTASLEKPGTLQAIISFFFSSFGLIQPKEVEDVHTAFSKIEFHVSL